MRRGTIIWVNLEDADPPEIGKLRPAVVVSNEVQNQILSTVVVIPLSTRLPQIWPLRLRLPQIPGLRESYAVIPGLRQISKNRITQQIGIVPFSFLKQLSDACIAYLSD